MIASRSRGAVSITRGARGASSPAWATTSAGTSEPA